MPRGHLGAGLCALLLAVLVLAAPASVSATSLPAGFVSQDLATGLDFPTEVAWTPDGRMLIAEKGGRLRVRSAAGVLLPGAPITISDHVNADNDRGLLGLAVDRDYATNNYIYLLYTHKADPEYLYGVGRLERWTLSPGNVAAFSKVMLGSHNLGSADHCPEPPSNTLDCIPSESSTHSIGTIRSDPTDGTLWVGAGDGASPDGGDPLAFRSQNEQSLSGKILHIDREGRGLPGHPFCPGEANLDLVCTKVHAKGLRNPYRFHLRPGGGIAIGDVGQNLWEEVDLVPTSLSPGQQVNLGWPCYEGDSRTPFYSDQSQCQALYAQEGQPGGPHMPAYVFAHSGGQGNAVVLSPEYTLPQPAGYAGTMLMGDYGTQSIVRLQQAGQDLEPVSEPPFSSSWPGISLDRTPSGTFSSVEIDDFLTFAGSVREWVWSPGNEAPEAHAVSAPTNDPTAPYQFNFDGQGSEDPDGDDSLLTYTWDFDEDGVVDSTARSPSHTYPATRKAYRVSVTVTDPGGLHSTAFLWVGAGTEPPTAEIDVPATFRFGQNVAASGDFSDPDSLAHGDTVIGRWNVVLRHNEHAHPVIPAHEGSNVSWDTTNDHDADSHYEVSVTPVDSTGYPGTPAVVDIDPETAQLMLRSAPAGAVLAYGGHNRTTPFDGITAIGFSTGVSAPDTLASGGETWLFDRWSDAGAQQHQIVVPPEGVSLTAFYREPDQPPGPTPPGPTPPAPAPAPPGLTPTGPPVVPVPRDRTAPTVALNLSRRSNFDPTKGIVAGTARDASGVRRVQLALRAAGKKKGCRWWSTRLRRLSSARSCTPRWITARLAGTRWRVALGRRVPPGSYVVYVRATDRAGNVSRRVGSRTTLPVKVVTPRRAR